MIELRNRIRCGVALVRGSSWFLAPFAFVYGFVTEPKQWRRYCEYMQKKLDYEREMEGKS